MGFSLRCAMGPLTVIRITIFAVVLITCVLLLALLAPARVYAAFILALGFVWFFRLWRFLPDEQRYQQREVQRLLEVERARVSEAPRASDASLKATAATTCGGGDSGVSGTDAGAGSRYPGWYPRGDLDEVGRRSPSPWPGQPTRSFSPGPRHPSRIHEPMVMHEPYRHPTPTSPLTARFADKHASAQRPTRCESPEHDLNDRRSNQSPWVRARALGETAEGGLSTYGNGPFLPESFQFPSFPPSPTDSGANRLGPAGGGPMFRQSPRWSPPRSVFDFMEEPQPVDRGSHRGKLFHAAGTAATANG